MVTSAKATEALARTKPGLGLLVALVIGSIIGSGFIGLPRNMAAGAEAGAMLVG